MFTWWADGGEKAGLDGLVGTFGTACSGQEFVNGAVAGGAGSNAKQVLASRLQQNDPPDTFQVHAGSELLDYIDAGQVEDISADYGAEPSTQRADAYRDTRSARKSSQVRRPTARSGVRLAPARIARYARPANRIGRIGRRRWVARR